MKSKTYVNSAFSVVKTEFVYKEKFMTDKIIKLFLCIVILVTTGASMKSKIDTVKGFYFLDWGVTFDEIMTILKKKEILFKDNSRMKLPAIEFEYDGFETSCYDDQLPNGKWGLYNVQQYKRFSPDQKKEADAAHDDILQKLTNDFGEPTIFNNEKERHLTIYAWNGKYTTINLSYFSTSIEVQVHWSITDKDLLFK